MCVLHLLPGAVAKNNKKNSFHSIKKKKKKRFAVLVMSEYNGDFHTNDSLTFGRFSRSSFTFAFTELTAKQCILIHQPNPHQPGFVYITCHSDKNNCHITRLES